MVNHIDIKNHGNHEEGERLEYVGLIIAHSDTLGHEAIKTTRARGEQ